MALFIALNGVIGLMAMWTVSKKQISHFSRASAEKVFMAVSFFLLTFLNGFRGLEVGNDTPMYVRYFNTLSGLKSIKMYNWRFEFGYRLYNCLISQFFRNAHALLLVSAIVTMVLLFKAFKKVSPIPVYSVTFFLAAAMYYNTYNMIRQYLAMVICVQALLFLMEKKRFKFVILTVIAGLFHTTAFLVLVCLLFSLIPYNKNRRYVYVVIGLIVTVFFSSLVIFLVRLMPKYSGYLNSESYYLQGKLGTIIRTLIHGLLFWFYDYMYTKYGKDTEENKILYFTALAGFFISLISIQGAILSRIAAYFNIMACIYIPTALSWIPDRKKKYIWATAILAGEFAYNLTILVFRPYWTGVIPYVFWG